MPSKSQGSLDSELPNSGLIYLPCSSVNVIRNCKFHCMPFICKKLSHSIRVILIVNVFSALFNNKYIFNLPNLSMTINVMMCKVQSTMCEHCNYTEPNLIMHYIISHISIHSPLHLHTHIHPHARAHAHTHTDLQPQWRYWQNKKIRYCTIFNCNGAEWSKDKTQAAESVKWRPQQAYGSNQFLLACSAADSFQHTHKIITLTHR